MVDVEVGFESWEVVFGTSVLPWLVDYRLDSYFPGSTALVWFLDGI